MPKIIANDIRAGNILEYNNKLWVVAKFQHTMPGKGGAFIQVEMKEIATGTKLNERFRSSETVERVRLDEKPFQFMFADDDNIHLMDMDTYDQISISHDLLGEQRVYLKEGMNITVSFHNETPITAEIPSQVICTIVESEPVVKGQTATSSYKPALLDNGVRVMVPPFIEVGTRVVVSTIDATYIERAKDE
jgi:elongation factor P